MEVEAEAAEVAMAEVGSGAAVRALVVALVVRLAAAVRAAAALAEGEMEAVVVVWEEVGTEVEADLERAEEVEVAMVQVA